MCRPCILRRSLFYHALAVQPAAAGAAAARSSEGGQEAPVLRAGPGTCRPRTAGDLTASPLGACPAVGRQYVTWGLFMPESRPAGNPSDATPLPRKPASDEPQKEKAGRYTAGSPLAFGRLYHRPSQGLSASLRLVLRGGTH
ncbi:hypothetical protein WJX75_008147 [Coccomyxa subellipsoidea]|uniref:Uncharacterized protein n=1 Tax=Coccomyxa subellipsoidea TaxID=248742 RepID=A0ABR2YH17_9CHLO